MILMIMIVARLTMMMIKMMMVVVVVFMLIRLKVLMMTIMIIMNMIRISVSDPHSALVSGQGYGSSIFCQFGSCSRSKSRSRVLMTKNWKKFTAEKKSFWSKIAIYLTLGLHKGRPNFRRTSLKREHLALQNLNNLHFCGSFWPSWFRIRIQPTKMNANP
jgi:hypothetical protein